VGERIGLLGGTFDPIHVGHLFMGEVAADRLGLERVIFIPAGNPPHKLSEPEAGPEHRLAMVNEAVRGTPGFEVSEIEIRRDGPSYTVDTVQEIRSTIGPRVEIYLIIGSDSLHELAAWRRSEELVSAVTLAVCPRPGFPAEAASPPRGSRVNVLDTGGVSFDVSSTAVRKLIREGRSVRYLVPAGVFEYIRASGLYKEE